MDLCPCASRNALNLEAASDSLRIQLSAIDGVVDVKKSESSSATMAAISRSWVGISADSTFEHDDNSNEISV